ncbi:MAG TPA: gliding motility-associated C-terminal domain-containing protein [Candidatus Avibacteroides excrementipullorum]|nr:gliding motility-associated C-terminal domain-containing protein [Candidatus Avibacteroides excrementipullorum]
MRNVSAWIFRRLSAAVLLAVVSLHVQAQDFVFQPYGVILEENNEIFSEPDTIYEGEAFTGSAPIVIRFNAGVAEPSSALRFEWQVSRFSDMEALELTRFDEETELDFVEAGTLYVRVIITDSESELTYESSPFSVTVSESKLEMPNAFSPNGDGINDVYKITYESIISLDAYIFNRWGQQIYHMDLSNVDEGWDGTYHGKQVKDGVYFIMVKAVGSDGVEYTKRKDINILRGTNGTLSGGNE